MRAVQPPSGDSNSRVRQHSRPWLRGALVLALAIGTAAASAGIALAVTGSATLSNGALLTVRSTRRRRARSTSAARSMCLSRDRQIGLGEADATIIYVMDFSGSTGATPSGSTCGTILACEKSFFVGLNAAAVADGSTDEVGVVKFSDSSSIALGLTDPANAAVNTAINSGSPGGGTNCGAGLPTRSRS